MDVPVVSRCRKILAVLLPQPGAKSCSVIFGVCGGGLKRSSGFPSTIPTLPIPNPSGKLKRNANLPSSTELDMAYSISESASSSHDNMLDFAVRASVTSSKTAADIVRSTAIKNLCCSRWIGYAVAVFILRASQKGDPRGTTARSSTMRARARARVAERANIFNPKLSRQQIAKQ